MKIDITKEWCEEQAQKEGTMETEVQALVKRDKQEPSLIARKLAKELEDQGYRKVSNNYRTVARIDRPDWVQVLADYLHRSPAEFYRTGEQAPDGAWADHYRRSSWCKDHLVIPYEIFRLIPSSGHDSCGYVPKFSRVCDQDLLNRIGAPWRCKARVNGEEVEMDSDPVGAYIPFEQHEQVVERLLMLILAGQ